MFLLLLGKRSGTDPMEDFAESSKVLLTKWQVPFQVFWYLPGNLVPGSRLFNKLGSPGHQYDPLMLVVRRERGLIDANYLPVYCFRSSVSLAF